MITALYTSIFTTLNEKVFIGSDVVPVSSLSLTNADRSIQLLSYNANPTSNKVSRIKNVVVNIDSVVKNGTPDELASIVQQVEDLIKPLVNNTIDLGTKYKIVWMKDPIYLNYVDEIDGGKFVQHTTLRYEMEIQTI